MEIAPVKGTHDIVGQEAAEARYIEMVLSSVAELYGYKEIIPPTLEYTDVFARGTGSSSDVVRKEMYTFLDKNGRSVTLRPEFTAGVARAVVSGKLYATSEAPIKLYYHGPAFRYERPQLGRYRQFNQFGVECLGSDSAEVDAETILLAMQAFQMLGFKDLHLKVNTIGDAKTRERYRAALKDYFGAHIDEMCADCHERLRLNPMRILDCKVESDRKIAADAPKIEGYLSAESEERYYRSLSLLNDFGIGYEKDETLVRGLDYYSEIVFEIHAKGPSGADYGALCGGGHYDGLIEQFGGPNMAGVGFAVGLERIQSLMKEEKLLEEVPSGIDLYVMPVGAGALEEAFRLTEAVRLLGYSAETPFAAIKMGSLFKKAEKRGAKFALILGEDEISKGVAQLKNLGTKEQKEIKLDDLEATLDEAFGEEGHAE
ncbi:MAG: histidine--tRNA ligase [Bacilli bacterium]|jgi:histidyl-tRNA synthetase|nr:histidine--tRNA ligase [Bacilli bacterium]